MSENDNIQASERDMSAEDRGTKRHSEKATENVRQIIVNRVCLSTAS